VISKKEKRIKKSAIELISDFVLSLIKDLQNRLKKLNLLY